MCCYTAAAGITSRLTERFCSVMDQAPPAHPGIAGMQRNYTEQVHHNVLLVMLDVLACVDTSQLVLKAVGGCWQLLAGATAP
jgi:hypothetical protein